MPISPQRPDPFSPVPRALAVRITGLSALFAADLPSPAADLPYTFTKVGPEYRLTLQPNPALYFGFRHTGDLTQPFVTIQMALGDSGPIFGYTPALNELQGFFRARGISVSAPEDQDGDLIDDVWELKHAAYLNPLFPNDANLLSPEPDAGGRNNLDYYRWKLGITPTKEVVSREISAFNFGEAIFKTEVVSREVSAFNGESIPLFHGEIYSREVSAFNLGAPLSLAEVVSKESERLQFRQSAGGFGSRLEKDQPVNGESINTSEIPEVYSREVTTFNFGAAIASTEIISREVSVNNTQQ